MLNIPSIILCALSLFSCNVVHCQESLLSKGIFTDMTDIVEKYKDDILNIIHNRTIFPATNTKNNFDPNDITFHLYTKENPSRMVQLDSSNPKVSDKKATYVIFLHDWLQSENTLWYEHLKNALLNKPDNYAVIQVNWHKLADDRYSNAVEKVSDIGNLIGKFITKLSHNSGVPHNQFMVVGHGLGGQIAGFIGKYYLVHTLSRLPRIVALDPSGPLFTNKFKLFKLNYLDAKVVSVIHTNGGKFGYYDPIGTIDFFVNGGSKQPGCALLKFCDHNRSYRYFVDAIEMPQQFMAKHCKDWMEYLHSPSKCRKGEVSMGDLKTTAYGNYYLKTNSIEQN